MYYFSLPVVTVNNDVCVCVCVCIGVGLCKLYVVL